MDRSSPFRQIMGRTSAVLGLSVLTVLGLMALFAVFLASDKSKHANRQIPALALQAMGFEQTCLRVHRNIHTLPQSWLAKWFEGHKESYIYVPIESWSIEQTEIIVKLVGGGQRRYHLADVLYPLKSVGDIKENETEVLFEDIYGAMHAYSPRALGHTIKEKHITKLRFLLGSDRFGRDIFSRLIHGIRVSLIVGAIAVFVSLLLGMVLGSIGGYYGGRVDDWVMLLINTSWSIPTLLLVFAIVLALGRGIGIIFVAVGLTMWVDVARIVRGEVIQLKAQPFVMSARSIGQRNHRIIWRHIVPNLIGPVLVVTAANFAIAILLEAGLSFLGFGVKPPAPSLGNLLNENYGYAIHGKIWLACIPAFVIMILVLSFNLIGSALRDAYDIKS